MTITRVQDFLRDLELDELEALLLEVRLTIFDKQNPTEIEVTRYLGELAESAQKTGDSTIRAEVKYMTRLRRKLTPDERLDIKLARALRKLQREHVT